MLSSGAREREGEQLSDRARPRARGEEVLGVSRSRGFVDGRLWKFGGVETLIP